MIYGMSLFAWHLEASRRAVVRIASFITTSAKIFTVDKYYRDTGTLGPGPCESFFFGVRNWLVNVLGQFKIIYFRGLGLRVWVWFRLGLGLGFVW